MRNKDYFIHPSSIVDEPASIGKGTKIWHFCHIMKDARIGEQCKIGQNVYIGPGVKIGANVKIQNNVSVYPGVILEDDVFCGPSMVFTNVINPRCEVVRNSPEFFKQTLVKQGASIGANATIICGVTIGRYAFIGAGAVVTKDIHDYALAYGTPAVYRGWMCECGEKLNFSESSSTACAVCGKEYIIEQDKCKRKK